jgi:putative Holliday junction resolvase
MGRIIAIDYGKKRCGIAGTDPLRMFASPLQAVLTTDLKDFLENYFSKEPVDEVLIGIPFTADGRETELIIEIKKFQSWLSNRFPHLSLKTIDEFGTSAEAAKALVMAGVPKKKRQDKSNIDVMSAVIMLKKYLEDYL